MRMLQTVGLTILFSAAIFHGIHAGNLSETDSLVQVLSTKTERDSGYMELAFQISKSATNSDVGKSLSMALLSLKVADSLGLQDRRGAILNQIGNMQRIRGDHSQAMKYYLESLRFFEQSGDKKWEANLHANLGTLYFDQNDLDHAMEEQEIALEIREEIGYFEEIAGIYNTMGNIHGRKGDLDLAMQYYQIALDSAAAANETKWMAMMLGNIGTLYGMKGELDKSMSMNRKALAIHTELGLKIDMARDQHNIGILHKMQNRPDSAIFYFRKSMGFAQKENVLSLMQANASAIKGIFSQKKDYQRALYWSNREFSIHDSLLNDRTTAEIKAAETNYRIEKEAREREFIRETQELESTAALKRQRILTSSAGVVIVLLILLAGILLRRNKEKKEVNNLLEEKVKVKTRELRHTNDQLQAEVEQKEQAQRDLNTYIYRSSHDLKGPLMSVKGLVEVASTDPAPGKYLAMVSTKVDQLDSLLERLIENVEADRRDLISKELDWEEIRMKAMDGLKRNEGPKPMSFELKVGIREPVVSDPYAVMGFLRHLLQNAIDFRDQEKATQTCLIWIRGNGRKWKIEVHDNGIGIPENIMPYVFDLYYRGNNLSRGNGMGLYLVVRAVSRLGGSVDLKSQEGQGTQVEVTLPNLYQS